jgi:integrase
MKYQNLLDIYLEQYQNAGRNYKDRANQLQNFLDYCSANQENRVDYETLQLWLKIRGEKLNSANLASLQNRISDFSEWARLLDKSIGRIPKASQVRKNRRKPVILNKEQVGRIILQQRNSTSKRDVSSKTFATITGLLYTTGIRVSEAIALRSSFVNLKERSIYIPCGKSPRDRIVPISKSTCEILKDYKAWHESFDTKTTQFFGHENADVALTYKSFYFHFVKIVTELGHRAPVSEGHKRQNLRIHDLRHSFAVNSLIKIYEEGVDVNEAIIQLSSIMGHKRLDETYWYIEAVPDLIAAAFKRELS